MGWISALARPSIQDEHGQPQNRLYRAQAVQARQVDELIGIIRGVLADGVICQQEVEYLLAWMHANKKAVNEWPANALYARIVSALGDGHMDAEEESEIMALLLKTVGGISVPKPQSGDASYSTALPLDDPLPVIQPAGKTFCFTGKFIGGTRRWCEDVVKERGGLVLAHITQELNFLVIGDIGSRDWLHSTHGLKIEKAVEYRQRGVLLGIVNEKHWYEQMTRSSC